MGPRQSEGRPVGRLGGRIQGLALSGAGLIAVVVGGRARVWDSRTLEPSGPSPSATGRSADEDPEPGREPMSLSVAPSADGALVAIGSSDSRVIVREAATGRVVREFAGDAPKFYGPPDPGVPMAGPAYKRVVSSVAFSPDAAWLAAGYGYRIASIEDYKQIIRVWSLRDGRKVADLDVVNTVQSLHCTKDGRTLIAACQDATIRSFETASWEPSGPTIRAGAEIVGAAVSPDEMIVAAGLGDGGLELWERVTGRRVTRVAALTGVVSASAFTPDGRVLATVSPPEQSPVLREAGTLRELLTLPLDGRATGVTFAPEGDALVIAEGGELRLWPAWPLDRIDAERPAGAARE